MTMQQHIAVVSLALVLCAIGAVSSAQQAPGQPAPPNQSPAAPTVSEADALKLDNGVLKVENLQLQIQQAQQALEKLQADLQAFAKTLERDGYQLQRGQDGKWSYAPAAPADTKPPGGEQ
jgi:TolA-binding protein